MDEYDETDELKDDPSEVIRAKWVMDGATTLSEAAEKLEAFATTLRQIEKDGWQLTGPVEDDYGFILPTHRDGA